LDRDPPCSGRTTRCSWNGGIWDDGRPGSAGGKLRRMENRQNRICSARRGKRRTAHDDVSDRRTSPSENHPAPAISKVQASGKAILAKFTWIGPTQLPRTPFLDRVPLEGPRRLSETLKSLANKAEPPHTPSLFDHAHKARSKVLNETPAFAARRLHSGR